MAYSTPRTWVAGEIVTAAMLNQDVRDNQLAAFPLGVGAWTSYTPTLTASSGNPTLGSGSTSVGAYQRIGRTIMGRYRIAFGSSGAAAGTGFYRIALPVAPANLGGSPSAVVGQAYMYDNSANLFKICVAYCTSSNQYLELLAESNAPVAAGVPWTWAASDQIAGSFIYEAAA